MKRILYLLVALSALMSVSCKPDLEPVPQYLEVNANNISGKWQLELWNETPLQEGTYVYIDIVRNDRTYKMYQNLDSFSDIPHVVSGSYYLETDPAAGAIIRGNYDHDSGDWAHRYIITELTEDQMMWTAKDDPTFVQLWKRTDSIPVAE